MAASPVEIQRIHGPLDDDRLSDIARLYGPHDPKYRRLEYLRCLYNEAPAGRSLHCFAFQNGTAVGHYSAIPFFVETRERRLVSAKGEAFAIQEKVKSETLIRGGKEQLIAVALAAELYEFAESEGIEVVHMLASRQVGLLHRMVGCKAARQNDPAYHLQLRSVGNRRTRSLGWAQFPIRFVYRILGFLPNTRTAVLNEPGLRPAPSQKACGWQVSLDDACWAWFSRLGAFEQLALTHRPAGCVVRPPNAADPTLEVVHWPKLESTWDQLYLLIGLIRHSVRHGAHRILIAQSAFEHPSFFCRLGRLGFFKRDLDLGFLLRSKTPFFRNGSNLVLSPLFRTTF